MNHWSKFGRLIPKDWKQLIVLSCIDAQLRIPIAHITYLDGVLGVRLKVSSATSRKLRSVEVENGRIVAAKPREWPYRYLKRKVKRGPELA